MHIRLPSKTLIVIGLPAWLFMTSPTFAASDIVKSDEAGVFSASSHTLQPGKRLVTQGSPGLIPTHTIPSQLGTQFGVRYMLQESIYSQKTELTLLYLTPGLIDTDGSHIDKIEVSKIIDEPSKFHVMAYKFTQAYEMVPGDWRFMVFLKDQKLIDHTFTVTPDTN